MYTFTIVNNSQSQSVILPGKVKITDNNNEKVTYFYTPTKKINEKMKIIYLYSSVNKSDTADFISWNDQEEGFKLIGSFFAFPNATENYDTHCLSISKHPSNIGLSIRWGKITGATLQFWIFKEPKYIKLYPLSAIVWPPAQRYADDITNIINRNYKLVKQYDVTVAKPKFLSFVRKIYKGDRRCDKSQLPRKCRHMNSYPLKMRYLKFLVEDADLDYMRVSQTAVKIKDIIRSNFKRKIPNYVHDICFHISDNASHSRSMDNYVKLEIREDI